MLSVDSCSCGTSPEDLDGWELLGWDPPSTEGVLELDGWELLGWDPPSTEGVLDLELLGWDSLDFGVGRGILGLDGESSSITNLSPG